MRGVPGAARLAGSQGRDNPPPLERVLGKLTQASLEFWSRQRGARGRSAVLCPGEALPLCASVSPPCTPLGCSSSVARGQAPDGCPRAWLSPSHAGSTLSPCPGTLPLPRPFLCLGLPSDSELSVTPQEAPARSLPWLPPGLGETRSCAFRSWSRGERLCGLHWASLGKCQIAALRGAPLGRLCRGRNCYVATGVRARCGKT